MRRLAVVVVMLVSTAALAQQSPRADANGRPITIIDVDADVIEGTLHRPDDVQIHHRKPAVFKSLIQLRKDFRGELLATGSHL